MFNAPELKSSEASSKPRLDSGHHLSNIPNGAMILERNELTIQIAPGVVNPPRDARVAAGGRQLDSERAPTVHACQTHSYIRARARAHTRTLTCTHTHTCTIQTTVRLCVFCARENGGDHHEGCALRGLLSTFPTSSAE